MTTDDDAFERFAEGAFPRLRRTAFLLCGDWHRAEDLTQITLTKMFASWRRIARQDEVNGYATKTLLNAYLTESRRKWRGEVPAGDLPDRPTDQPGPELRLTLIAALSNLPPKARAVIILRYWADLSIEQTAAVLGCSEGTVKSQSARALDKLRSLLHEPDLENPERDHRSQARRDPDGRDISARTA